MDVMDAIDDAPMNEIDITSVGVMVDTTSLTETIQPKAEPSPVIDEDYDSQVEDEDADTDYTAEIDIRHCIELAVTMFVPVSLCILLVVITVTFMGFYIERDVYLLYTPFHETSPDFVFKALNAIGNSLIMVFVIITMSLLLITVYKFRCYKLIQGWLVMTSSLLLFVFSGIYFHQVFYTFNIPIDFITFFLFIWNIGMMGLVCIHLKGPLALQQIYLIFTSALVSLIFIKYMPDWTTWTVLFFVSLWDLFAVLTPIGPLRILVEMANKRNEDLFPTLLYTSTILHSVMNSRPASVDNTTDNQKLTPDKGEVRKPPSKRVQQDSTGIKLGLGDFIFYSVLVGKACTYGDWNSTLACYIAILVGLCITLIILTVRGHPLPALPISITFGLVFFFVTNSLAKPFMDMLASKQIFI